MNDIPPSQRGRAHKNPPSSVHQIERELRNDDAKERWWIDCYVGSLSECQDWVDNHSRRNPETLYRLVLWNMKSDLKLHKAFILNGTWS